MNKELLNLIVALVAKTPSGATLTLTVAPGVNSGTFDRDTWTLRFSTIDRASESARQSDPGSASGNAFAPTSQTTREPFQAQFPTQFQPGSKTISERTNRAPRASPGTGPSASEAGSIAQFEIDFLDVGGVPRGA